MSQKKACLFKRQAWNRHDQKGKHILDSQETSVPKGDKAVLLKPTERRERATTHSFDEVRQSEFGEKELAGRLARILGVGGT